MFKTMFVRCKIIFCIFFVLCVLCFNKSFSKELVCCPEKNEPGIILSNKVEFDSYMSETIEGLESLLSSKANKFDRAFRMIMYRSKKNFHDVFLSTYGILYEGNSRIFLDLFTDLENYYKNGSIDLNEAIERFFKVLYQKMFEVLNSQKNIDEKYDKCIESHMEKLEPFGDVPKKLMIEVNRSFFAARVFYLALNKAKEIIEAFNRISTTSGCHYHLLLMRYCQICNRLSSCKDHCVNAVSKCLQNYLALDKDWNKFIDSLIKLIIRLETSFNIESVIDPIDVKISEAIMNFQENENAIRKLQENCGIDNIKRRLIRSVFVSNSYHYGDNLKDQEANMNRLLNEIKRKIKKTKNFWSKLPGNICNKLISKGNIDKERKCPNGNETVKFDEKNALSVSMKDEQLTFVDNQIKSLKLETNFLNFAFNGGGIQEGVDDYEFRYEDCDDEDCDNENNNDSEVKNSDLINGSGSGSGDREDVYKQYMNPGVASTETDVYFSSSSKLAPSSEESNIIPLNDPNVEINEDSENEIGVIASSVRNFSLKISVNNYVILGLLMIKLYL